MPHMKPQKNCNRESALKRSIGKLLGARDFFFFFCGLCGGGGGGGGWGFKIVSLLRNRILVFTLTSSLTFCEKGKPFKYSMSVFILQFMFDLSVKKKYLMCLFMCCMFSGKKMQESKELPLLKVYLIPLRYVKMFMAKVITVYFNWTASNEKVPSNMHKMCISCACAKYHLGLYYPSYILYLIILLADNEGPDQTARMRRLIWALAVRICPKTLFRMAQPS